MQAPIPKTEAAGSYGYAVGIIPTRDRADLAINAIQSVLEQPQCNVKLMVSDNSTFGSEIEQLRSYCDDIADERLTYVRPPRPLPMSSHWDWAIGKALASYYATHFFFLTDRMMFKPNALRELIAAANQFPNHVISYNHDRIIDDRSPIRVEQYLFTGKLLEVSTQRLSYLYSQALFHHAFPRMLNCLVPRRVFERIKNRFGTIFSSIAPDFLFCCRCLEAVDTIIYYDKSLMFHYALDRSHGASISRGEMTRANRDFRANLQVDAARRNYATPIPELITAANCIYNEYLIVKGETKSSRFYEIDFEKYLRVNAEEIEGVIDPKLKVEMEQMLERHGFIRTNGAQRIGSVRRFAKLILSPRDVLQRLKTAARRIASDQWTKPFWIFLARTFGITPPADNRFIFTTVEEAVDYMKKYPRRNLKDWPSQDELLQARELPLKH